MTDQHEDPKFEQWLKDSARTTYHAPRTTPREEMWARIAAERQRRAGRVIELRPWMRWAVAAAAVLVIGIGIGRWTADQTQGPNGLPVAVANDTTASGVAYQVVATQYLSRAEAFLTGFRADLPSGPEASNARLVGQARDLLTTTRLMLDSPAGDDPRLRSLLEDLELVLVQIAAMPAGAAEQDLRLITRGLNEGGVLSRLRAVIPAGPMGAYSAGQL